MKTFLTKFNKLRNRTTLFRSVLGGSFFLIALVMFFGVPQVTHAENCLFSGDVLGCLADASFGRVFEAISFSILMLANLIIYVVGSVFNEIIIYTVFQFGDYFGNSAGLLAGWSVLRDFANIVLIFGFVMLGVATILDIHGYEVKKTLPRLIIFAILLNFSLLASEAIIDTSNAFAALLYTQASQTCTQGTTQQCAQGNSGISGAVFQLSGIASAFSPNSIQNEVSNTDHTHNGIAYIGMAVFVTVLSVVLLAGVVMLVTRGIVLALLMILSPFGFAGLAVPPLEKYAKMWWDKLLSQAFFAPLYLLLILIGLKVAQGLTGKNVDIMTALIKGQTSAIGSVVIFSILIGFMVAALLVAKQLGAVGAQFATGMATSVVSYPFAIGGRGLGWLSNKYGADRFQQWVGRDKEHRSKWGNRTAKLLSFTGADQAIYGALKAPAKSKIGPHAGYDEYAKESREFASHAKHVAEASELKEALEGNNLKLAESIAQKMGISNLEEAMKDMDSHHLDELSKILSPEKFSKLMDSEKVDDDKKEKMRAARFADVINNTKSAKDLGTEDLVQLSKHDRQFFIDKIKEINNDTGKSALKDEQLDALSKSKELGDELRKIARDNTGARRVERIADEILDENGQRDTKAMEEQRATAIKVWSKLNADSRMKVDVDTVVKNKELREDVNPLTMNAYLIGNKLDENQLNSIVEASKTSRHKDAFDKYEATSDFARALMNRTREEVHEIERL